jgi:putative transposase
MAESCFASLECELLDRRTFKTRIEARLAVFTWIEAWYNPRRRHSGLGRVSPAEFERKNTPAPERQRVEHDLPPVGVCVACATPPGDKSATELFNTA